MVTPDGMGEERKVEEIPDAKQTADASFLTPPKVANDEKGNHMLSHYCFGNQMLSHYCFSTNHRRCFCCSRSNHAFFLCQ